jgi:hypothetical protein
MFTWILHSNVDEPSSTGNQLMEPWAHGKHLKTSLKFQELKSHLLFKAKSVLVVVGED